MICTHYKTAIYISVKLLSFNNETEEYNKNKHVNIVTENLGPLFFVTSISSVLKQ